MSRKVSLKVTVDMTVRIDEGQDVSEVIDEMDYWFNDETGNATIEDTAIADYEIVDSK